MRQLAQALWLVRGPAALVPSVSMFVDFSHAVSMAMLATTRRDYRGAAMRSLGMSVLLVGASVLEDRSRSVG
jgi:hypothetical protein